MTNPSKTAPADCPEPFNHEIFHYCPTCTWTDDYVDDDASTLTMGGDHTKIKLSLDPKERRMWGVATHGMTPFDVPFMSEIADGLFQGGCERGLVLPKHIKNLVSLYPWEQYTLEGEMDTILIVKMYDSVDQTFEQVEDIAKWVAKLKGDTLVHCQAGLNRSSLIVARVLMLRGMTAREAIDLIREKRSPACLCNPAFEAYLQSL